MIANDSPQKGNEPIRPTKLMLVAWALGECGGDREYVDKVDVAMYAFRAYPHYFGFQKYPEHPDVSSVRLQLYDLLKPKNSKLFGLDHETPMAEKAAEGGSPGLRLSADGIVWWRTNRDWLSQWVERNAKSDFGTTKSVTGRVKSEDDAKRALLNRVRGTAGFAAWSRNHKVTRREVGIQTFFTSFGIGPRTPRPEYVEARDRLFEIATSDEESLHFLTFLDHAFGEDYKRILSGDVQI
jgi:hypothetical protein